MSDTRVVYITSLTMAAPGRLIYHAANRRSWKTADCGRAICRQLWAQADDTWTYIPMMVPMRRDTADLIGRPCSVCKWENE